MAQSERISNGEHPIAHFDLIGVADACRRQIFPCVNLNYGDVCLRVFSDDLRFELSLVSQGDRQFFCAFHYMVVGKYVAVPGNYYARSCPLNGSILREPGMIEKISKREPRYLHLSQASFLNFGYFDIYNRGGALLSQSSKRAANHR